MSWRQMAIANDNPNFIDAPKPEPIAKPSGKLWSANPILTMMPVFNKVLLLKWLFFILMFLLFSFTCLLEFVVIFLFIYISLTGLLLFFLPAWKELENFLSTNKSQPSIAIIPKKTPKNTVNKLVSPKASGNKSKQTMANIRPEAKAKIKLKNFCEGFLNLIPIMPPIVVPKVPKNKPIIVVLTISFNRKNSFFLK